MPKKAMESLTQAMFYVLMALCTGERCGTDIAAWVEAHTGGRVPLGPATLYTILGKFGEEKYIEQTQVEGRRRTYRITARGRAAYSAELIRLRACVQDAESAEDTDDAR